MSFALLQKANEENGLFETLEGARQKIKMVAITIYSYTFQIHT
jgi:hypothetical protein